MADDETSPSPTRGAKLLTEPRSPKQPRRAALAGALVALLAILVGVGATVGVGRGQLARLFHLGAQQAATATPYPTSVPTPTVVPLPPGNDWSQYRFDLQGTGSNPETLLSANNVSQLALRWSVHTTAAFESTPAVVDGVVYVTNGNSLYAFDLRTSARLWRFDARPQKIATVSSSVAVDSALHLAFYGNPDARVYAVDTRTGQAAWSVQLSASRGAHIWSSPLIINGNVYIGLASHDDVPCVRGAIFALDEQTGKIIWTHYTVSANALGGAVWSSLTANPSLHELIATTGNPCPEGPAFGESDSILGIDWNTGITLWSYQALSYDVCDCDFGQGAVDFEYQGQEYIIAGNKHGTVYALTRKPSGGVPHLAWSRQISGSGFLGQGGVFEPPTYSDGLVIFAGGPTLDGACSGGGLWALQAQTGRDVWRACTSGQVAGPAALTNGLLFVPQQNKLVVYQASTGRTLEMFQQSGVTWGGVSVSHGFVLDGTVSDTLYCYALPPTPFTTGAAG